MGEKERHISIGPKPQRPGKWLINVPVVRGKAPRKTVLASDGDVPRVVVEGKS